MSPGKFTQKNSLELDRKRAWSKERRGTRSFKKRRLDLKAQRLQKSSASEVREGKTYESSIDTTPLDPADVVEIPPATTLSGIEANVFFDLETTGLGSDAQIVQIACKCGEKEFNRYIVPRKPMSQGASEVTGITVIAGKLFLNNVQQDTVDLTDALTDFKTFLGSLNSLMYLV